MRLEDSGRSISVLEDQVKYHLTNEQKLNSTINRLQRENRNLLESLYQAENEIKDIQE